MHQPVEEIKESRLMIVKLANGETVMGQVERETQGYIEMKMPLKLVTFFNQKGNLTLSVLKWDVSIDFDYPVRIFKSTIVACGKPNENMTNNYNEIMTSGFTPDEEETSTEQDLETIEEKIAALMNQTKGVKLH